MTFDNAIIEAVSKGEKLDEIKQLTPKQAFQLGLLVKKLEEQKK